MSTDYGAKFDFLEAEPVGRALDCLGPRHQTGPFHYLINEQAKSLLALQELQHEVGALLEFRDLVIETFPSLRTKAMAGTSAARPDWVPGIRVRRKLGSKKADAVPDSGFSTETSSKDTHSASSTAMPATSAGAADETEDELWSLLDIIHRKGTRLKDEVAALQDQLQDRNDRPCDEDVHEAVFKTSREDVEEVRRERDLLMGRMADMEAEVVAGRIQTSRLQEDVERLLGEKQDLEHQLRAVLDERGEVNSRIRDMHAQFVVTKKSARTVRARTQSECELDRVLGAELPKVEVTDNGKFSAILAERNPAVLQRHLLTSTVQNEILLKRLENATRLEVDLADKLGKVREENEELKFQLEDKSIQLEGTRAQVRVLEQLQRGGSSQDGPDVILSSTPSRSEILSTSMKHMSPIPMTLQIDHSSSTESAHHDQQETNKSRSGESGRRKPSKIPLKSYTAPKPPGRGKTPHSSSARSRSSGGHSPHRPHSAQSTRGGARSEANSLQASKGGGSLVTSKDSLSSKLRGSDSLSRLSNAGGATLRKSSAPNAKWIGKETANVDKVDSDRGKSRYRWSPSSFENEADSLDLNSSSHRSTTTTTDSSSHKFQTANTFTWNRTRDYYDSINSELSSSGLYQQNGEELAECDSLEKIAS